MGSGIMAEPDFEKLRMQLAFLTEIDKMKSVYRQNIVIDGSRREDDASHSWHMTMFALVMAEYAPEGTDMMKVVKMCLVHDLVEIYAGDTFCYDYEAAKNKEEREKAAADKLYAILPEETGKEFRELWEEFDHPSTKESRFAAAMDRLQPFILNCNTGGHTWKKADVKRSQLYDRLCYVREELPEFWPYFVKMYENTAKEAGIVITD